MKTKELMSFIFPYLKKYKLDYSILFIFILVGILLQPGIAWFFQNMTNSIFDSGENNLVMYLIVGIALIITIVITNYLNSYYIAKTTSMVKKDVRTDLFQHLLKLPMSFIVSNHSGNLQSRIHQDTSQLDGVLGHNIAQFIIIPISGIVSFMYLAFISLPLALITLTLGPLILLVSKLFGVVIRNNGEVIQEQVAKMSRQLQETYDGHTIIKVFNIEKALTKKYTNINDDLLKLQVKEGAYSAILQAISIGISYCSQIMVFAIGTFFVANKQITVGDLLAFIVLSQALITPFSNMGNLWTTLQRSLSAVQRIYEMLHLPIATDSKKEDVKQLPVQITFDNVSFAYEQDQQILHNINLQIKPRERVAIIGESGSGKTTLMKLLLGLYQPTEGNIFLQPEGENKGKLEGFNPYTTYVPQDAFLFDDTIQQNIHYGNLNASDDEVVTAAKIVSADSFIQNLQGAYNFQVGERGNQLSGGQRQRVTLARAFIAEKSLIVFDEATSALDIQTEESILQQQFKLQSDYQSLLMITHRLSAAKYCDKIILLRNGIISAQGTHEELLTSSDYYQELYQQYVEANTRTTVDEREIM